MTPPPHFASRSKALVYILGLDSLYFEGLPGFICCIRGSSFVELTERDNSATIFLKKKSDHT